MKMNKINLQPFNGDKNSHSGKEVSLTPRVTIKKKQNISHINKLRMNKPEAIDRQETIHFDDTFCFRENNRQFSNRQTCRDKSGEKKKCFSQILNVKMVHQIRNKRKGDFFQSAAQVDRPKSKEGHIQFNPFFDEDKEERQADKNKRNYTSYSNRKKYHTIKPQAGFLSQRTKSHGGVAGLNKSTLVPNINPECLPDNFQQNQQIFSVKKIQGKSKYFWMLSKTDPLKLIAQQKQKQLDHKQVNYYQYSIIRPDEIKSLTLLQRQEQKEMIQKRKKQQKVLYLQMLHQIKKKQELAKRNAKLKEQITRSKKKQVKPREKVNVQVTITKKRNCTAWEQKNEFRPWDVQINTPAAHLTDIL